MVVANGSNSSFIMIFDESKKKKLNQTMSAKRKIDKVNALLRQRQNELITSLEAETQEIQESTFQLLNSTIKLPDRPLVIHLPKFMANRFAWNSFSDAFSGLHPNSEPPRTNWRALPLSCPPLPSVWHFHLPFSCCSRRMCCSAKPTKFTDCYSVRTAEV